MSDPDHPDVLLSQTDGLRLIEHERDFLYGLVKIYRDGLVFQVSTLGNDLYRFEQQLNKNPSELVLLLYRILVDYHFKQSWIASALKEGLSDFEQDSPIKSDDSSAHVVLADLPTSRSQSGPVEQNNIDILSSDKFYDRTELENAQERHSRPASEHAELIDSVNDLGLTMMNDLLASMELCLNRIVSLYTDHGCRRALNTMQRMDHTVRGMALDLQCSSKLSFDVPLISQLTLCQSLKIMQTRGMNSTTVWMESAS